LVTFLLVLTACVSIALADAPQAQRTKRLYDTYCYVCHGTGWQGAPLTGNSADWQPRIDKGWDAVMKNAKAGLNGMPAKGTCEECTDTDFRAVIEMMVEESK
jgi:cytochrome c5